MLDLSLFTPSLSSAPPTLEEILCSSDYFGLDNPNATPPTKASALQRATCRAIDGLPLGHLAHDPGVIRAFGGQSAVESLPAVRPKEVVLLAGIRSGKSLMAAAIAVRAALTCDMTSLGPGEIPRVSIVSLSRDTARPTWDHVVGRCMASPKLRALVVGKPKGGGIVLRHPSGRAVEICVVAGSRAAGTLVARWSAGNIFDEAAKMVGEDEGVVNLDHARIAIAGRLLPGAQVVMAGSSWAPFGPVYDIVAEDHGKPTANMCVIRARGPDLNPAHWTPERCAELKQRDPDAYRVDVETEFLDPESGMFAHNDLELCCDRPWEFLDPMTGHHYSAAIDPATRGNAWTLVVLGRNRKGRYFVCRHQQWIGSTSEPLSPLAVFGDIASILAPYGVKTLHTDQWAADALVDIATQAQLWLVSESISNHSKLEMFTALRAVVADKNISLPHDMQLLLDLARVKKRTTPSGIAIHFPRTADGRHCDYAPAIALALAHAPRGPDPEPQFDEETEAGRAAALKEKIRLQVEAQNRIKAKRQWAAFKRGY